MAARVLWKISGIMYSHCGNFLDLCISIGFIVEGGLTLLVEAKGDFITRFVHPLNDYNICLLLLSRNSHMYILIQISMA